MNILENKNKIYEIRKLLDELNSRLDTKKKKKWINEFKVCSTENFQTEAHKGKIIRKQNNIPLEICGTLSNGLTYV